MGLRPKEFYYFAFKFQTHFGFTKYCHVRNVEFLRYLVKVLLFHTVQSWLDWIQRESLIVAFNALTALSFKKNAKMISRKIASKNFRDFLNHSVEISEFFSYSDFAWNERSSKKTELFSRNIFLVITIFLFFHTVQGALCGTVWKNEKLSLTEKKIRQINFSNLINVLVSRNFCQKRGKVEI